MTVNTSTASASYTGNGATSIFSVPFYWLVDTDLVVTRKSAATGAITTLVLNSDYTLSGAGNEAGGSLTTIPALPNGDTIFIARNVDAVQQTAYPDNGPFPASSHEKALDRLTMLVQQLLTQVGLKLGKNALDTSYDAGGNTIANVADAVNAQDVPSWAQVQTLATSVSSGIIPSLIVKFTDLIASSGSALVGFIQAGANVVARTLQDKGHESISVRDFGAKGDGITDDTTAIQNAINYCCALATKSSVGVRLYFPAGQYKTSAALNVTAAILIYGDACGATAFQTNNNYVFNCTASNAQFRDLFFLGPYGTQSNGIALNGANNARIEHCYFQDQTVGVYLNNSFAVRITECTFDVCYTYGIVANTAAHHLQVQRCGFFTCGMTNLGHAINMSVASNNVGIKDNDFETCYVNVQLVNCSSVEITGNYMEYAYYKHFSFTGTNYGVIIEANWIALGDSGGGGNSSTINNVVGGRFRHNALYNQSVSFDPATVFGFTVGLNHLTGTGTIGDMWASPTLVNSWAQQTNYTAVGYTKDENGWVKLRGALVSGTAPSTLFTLPAGFRPASVGVFSTQSANGACRCTVNTDGTVVATVAASNNMSLDGIAFYVGN